MQNTSKALSRRSAIALVGVSAIAVSAVATVLPASASLPIGELSYPELGEEFAAVYERWRLRQAEYQAILDRKSDTVTYTDDDVSDGTDEIDDVCKKIAALPARSLADLALKARAVALANFEHWASGSNVALDFIVVRSLVDDLCNLAGLEVLPGIAD